MVICRNEEEAKRRESRVGLGVIRSLGGGCVCVCCTYCTVKDVDRVGKEKSSLRAVAGV